MNYFNNKRLYSPNFASSSLRRGKPINKKKAVFWLLSGFIFFVVVIGFWLTKNVLIDLPDVSEIKDMVFNEATIIEDRN